MILWLANGKEIEDMKLALFGSTGSIGRQTLNVVRNLAGRVNVSALCANSNVDLIEAQVYEFAPDIVCLFNEDAALELKSRLRKDEVEIVSGMEGLKKVASMEGVDFAMMGMVGSIGLIPAVEAIKTGKNIGLANKEILVAGGELVTKLAREHGVNIVPVDSEHSAIFECLVGESIESVEKLILTASGGPFLHHDMSQLKDVTRHDAANHPTWTMGEKVSIDCSTLMNKGLEVIEAHHLFQIPIQKIDVVIHPQSAIHSMVEFVDGSIKAQIGKTSMEHPIQYAMTYPDRLHRGGKRFSFIEVGKFDFYAPDKERFKCLRLAYDAIVEGGTLPCFMNAANEVLVERFCSGEVKWPQIAHLLEDLMQAHETIHQPKLEDILEVDRLAREKAQTHR